METIGKYKSHLVASKIQLRVEWLGQEFEDGWEVLRKLL